MAKINQALLKYHHPIFLVRTHASYNIRLTLSIDDDNSQAYTTAGVITKLKSMLDDGAMIQVNGFFMSNGVCYDIFIMRKDGNNYVIGGNDYLGNIVDVDLDTYLGAAIIFDDVNKQ